MNDQIVFEDKSAPNTVGTLPMHIYQSAGGDWIFFDGVDKHRFDTEQEARLAMAAMEASEKSIEAELAAKITGELLPKLRELFAAMTAMQLAWQDNEMSAIIADAAQAQTAIVGFSPETWALWGETFNALQGWLETENAALGGVKPRTVLMRRYVAQVSA